MAIRNFWLECEVDGRKTPVHCGPRGKNDGMSIRLYSRSKGKSKQVLSISCTPYTSDGEHYNLEVYAYDEINGKDLEIITER